MKMRHRMERLATGGGMVRHPSSEEKGGTSGPNGVPHSRPGSGRKPEPRTGRPRARRFRLLPVLALLLAALSPFAAAPAAADVLVSNIGQTGLDNLQTARVFARAQGFTTGSNGGGYTLESIEIRTNVFTAALTAQQIATIEAELWSSSSGKPGSKLADLTVPSSFATGARASTFSAPAGTTLAASTEYHVVVYTTAETLSTFELTHNAKDAEDSGAAAGWSIANAGNFFRNGSAAPTASSTWTAEAHGRSMKIRVNGAAVPLAAPTGLRVTPGPTRLDVSWTAPPGTVTGYDVHYTSAAVGTVANDAAVQAGTNGATGWVAVSRNGHGARTSHRIGKLPSGSAHRVRVRATSAGGDGAWAFGAGTPEALGLPGLTVTPGNAQLLVTWTRPDGDFVAYELDYTSAPRTGAGAVADAAASSGSNAATHWVAVSADVDDTDTSYTITGLTNGRAYRVRLRTAGPEGAYVFATGTPTSNVPSGLTLRPGDRELTARWKAPAGVDVARYEVQSKLKSAAAWPNTDTDVTGTSHTFTGLAVGETYLVRVRSVKRDGMSAGVWTAPVEAALAPAAPTGLTVTPGDGKLDLSWTAPPVGTVTAYWVDYTTSTAVAADARARGVDEAVGWVALQRASGPHNDATATSYTVRGRNLQRYRVRVRASNAGGRLVSPWVEGAGTPEGLLLTGLALTKAQGENASYDALALSPGFSPRVTDYTAAVPHAVTHVKARPTVGVLGGYVLSVGKRGAAAVSLTSGDTSGAIALDAGANAIEVVASSTLGQGANTTWTVTVTRHAQNAPAAPAGLAVTPGDGRLDLAWTAPSGTLTGYDVHYTASNTVAAGAAVGTNVATEWVAVSRSGTAASQAITGLDDGTTYRVRVRAENASGKGFWAHATGTTEGAVATLDTTTPTVTLSASPTVAEGSSVTVTATLSAALSSSVTIPLTITDGTAEPEDHGTLTGITIASGATNGTGTITTAQDSDTDDETFTVALGTLPSEVTAGSPRSVQITIRDDDRGGGGGGNVGGGGGNVGGGGGGGGAAPDLTPSFGSAAVAAQSYKQNTAITALTLPRARGGDGTLTYRLTPEPPSGLALDSGARTLSGTPEAAQGPVRYTWTVRDADGDEAALTFTVEVEENLMPSFGDAAVADQSWTAGTAIAALALPAATGGDGTLTYRLAPSPPPGLSLDLGTRRLSGTPSRSQRPVRYTWTVRDADGDEAALTFAVAVAADPRRAAVEGAVRRALAAVVRRATASALDNIGSRFADIGASGVTLAGQAVSLDGSAAAYALRDCAPERYAAAGLVPASGCTESRALAASDLFGASAFSVRLASAEDAGPAAPQWAVWGRGDLGTFAGGGETGLRYDGKLRTGWLGVDGRSDPWVAGLAVSHGTGEADYSFAGGALTGRGRLETTLTAVYPYGRWTLADGLELRAVAGAGWGEARHEPGDADAETGDLTMRMASVGVRRALGGLAGAALAVRADASVTQMETDDGPDAIHGLSADSWRLRAGLEASRRFALAGESSLEPFLEAAVRHDGGDGLKGSGFELAGGVRYAAPGVSVEMRGRWLAAHSEEGAEERGVSLTVRAGPGAGGRGLFFALAPRWGAGTGGARALWAEEMPNPAASGDDGALDAQVGYGFGTASGGVLTPFAEAGLAGGESRRLRLGARYEARGADLRVELAGERRESAVSEPEHELGLDLSLRF